MEETLEYEPDLRRLRLFHKECGTWDFCGEIREISIIDHSNIDYV